MNDKNMSAKGGSPAKGGHSAFGGKKVMILFGKSDWRKAKPFSNKEYQYSYEYFYSLCKENGIQMYRASYEWYDYKKNVFKHAWVYEGEGGNWKKVSDVEPDLVYDKTKGRREVYYKKELIAQKYPFINDLDFTEVVDNKFITSLIFSEWSKKSYLIRSLEELDKVLPELKTELVVVKPVSESGGNGVQILEKQKLLENISFEKSLLIQEFIDSSKGVPGVSVGKHDLRIVFVNEKMIYAYIREPQEGSYLANLAQGGSLKIVPLENLPESLNPSIEKAKDVFKSFHPKIYTVDFMFDENGKPWVIELNSMPGLYFTPEEKPHMIKMYGELLDAFKEKLSQDLR